MKSHVKQNTVSILSLLLALPAAYFMLSSFLKFELNINGPFDVVAPLLDRMGVRERLGWNINLLILLGPVAALGLTALQVLKIHWHFNRDEFLFHFSIKKKWFPLLVIAFSCTLLAILAIYLLGENCR